MRTAQYGRAIRARVLYTHVQQRTHSNAYAPYLLILIFVYEAYTQIRIRVLLLLLILLEASSIYKEYIYSKLEIRKEKSE